MAYPTDKAGGFLRTFSITCQFKQILLSLDNINFVLYIIDVKLIVLRLVSMIKLLMTWNIKSGSEGEYFEFVLREFAPGIMRLGLRPTETWYTYYGDCPHILTGAVTDDLETMQGILKSAEWQSLYDRLQRYITDYRQKIVRATNRFQLF